VKLGLRKNSPILLSGSVYGGKTVNSTKNSRLIRIRIRPVIFVDITRFSTVYEQK
jgi:hypothetical protein